MRRWATPLLSLLVLVLAGSPGAPAGASHGTLAIPGPAGSEWEVLAGYNTATHSAADRGDPYALDIVRTDAPTDGTPVLAPVSGTVSYTSDRCLTVRDAHGMLILMCHVFPEPNIRGRQVARGQRIAVVAPPGQAGNNGISHIHIAVNQQSGNRTGANVPFDGEYSIEGIALPATSAPNAYYGTRFRSNNTPLPLVDAGADQTVRPGALVTLVPTGTDPEGRPLRYFWSQTAGTRVDLSPSGASVSFVAPSAPGTLEFRVTALDPMQQAADDSVRVTVAAAAPTPASSTRTAGARLVSGSIPAAGGFGIFVFSGGTSADLLAASGCPRQTAAFWATSGGAYVVYLPGTTVASVNAAWNRLFSSGIPANTALLGKCR